MFFGECGGGHRAPRLHDCVQMDRSKARRRTPAIACSKRLQHPEIVAKILKTRGRLISHVPRHFRRTSLLKQLIFALAITCQSTAVLALPCEGSRLVVAVAGWSVKSPAPGSYRITVDLQGQAEPMKNANGRIFFIDRGGDVISSTKIARHLQINPGSWTKQTTKSNNARWGRLIGMNHSDVSVSTCVHSVSFEDGTAQAF